MNNESETYSEQITQTSRRNFLKVGFCAAAAGLIMPLPTLAQVSAATVPERSLSLYNTHTGETLHQAVYWVDGHYVSETLDEINYLLRDHRANQVAQIDPSLFDMLHAIHSRMETSKPFHIISGYRSPVTNASLRKHSKGVAKHSLHMDGKAMDIRLPGRQLASLRKTAMGLKVGGVGYYPDSDFVHVDTGRVRFW